MARVLAPRPNVMFEAGRALYQSRADCLVYDVCTGETNHGPSEVSYLKGVGCVVLVPKRKENENGEHTDERSPRHDVSARR